MGKIKELNSDEFKRQIEIYDSDIDLYTSEYIDNLSDETMIYKTMIFNGLLQYIYVHVFKYKGNTTRYHNKNSTIDYSNTDIINHLIDIYISLCFKYNHIPSILGFSVMTGIDNQTITSWLNGEYRQVKNDNVYTHSETAKRLKSICEHALLANATENNSIGSIFALKANYNYSDQPKAEIPVSKPETITLEEVQQRYQLGNIDKPVYDD